MNNYLQTGEKLTVAAPYDRLSGQAALIGSLLGVAVSDVLSGADGVFVTEGVFTLPKTSAQAWTVGQKLYWDNTNKRLDSDSTVGMLVGVATAVAANPSSTGECRLNGSAPSTSEGPQAAIVTLTDSTGLSGTHNDTLAATAALVTLTDSTGLSGTHDDTLAATSVPVDLTGGESPTEAEHNAALAVMRIMAQNASDLAQKQIEVVAQLAVTNQNVSDVGQKVIEILAALVAAGIIAA